MTKKYRLGNQPEEYQLLEDYLGWKPEGFQEWYDAVTKDNGFSRRPRPFSLTLVDPSNTKKVSIIVHQTLIKDAFPLHFFGEARAIDWFHFAIVSLTESASKQFLIPLH